LRKEIGGRVTDQVLEQEIAAEQSEVTTMYNRLDVLREQARAQLQRVQREEPAENDQGWTERESFTDLYSGRFSQLSSVESGLCFGRIDEAGGDRFHIGRIGLFNEDYDPILIDWRTPVAQVFYRATAADPLGVKRRRHIRLNRRTVVGVDDDVLDLDALGDAERSTLIGEAALLSSLGANRTGRMNEIVATIQSEQDEIIRSALSGVLVVQGGPGTGKTVVALHRAAYLLYTYRKLLARSGVLVVGPNSTFLRYIDQVLPSLGETAVVLTTVGELYPGVKATAPESAEASRIKGDLAMVGILERAVRGFERIPSEPIKLRLDRRDLLLDPDAVRTAQESAREPGDPHNPARRAFERMIIQALTDQAVDDLGRREASAEHIEDIRRELSQDHRVQAVVEQLWPELTPQLLVSLLFSSPERLAGAAPDLSDAERGALLRPVDSSWAQSDVALLDEAAELLGETAGTVTARNQKAAESDAAEAEVQQYARGVVDIELTADRIVIMPWEIEQFAKLVADRNQPVETPVTAAERAASDRSWVFGHVIVDEAQELSEMDWRMLMRRCPHRSMTLVGDIAQTGSAAGVRSWAQLLDRYAPQRWRTAELTVNYRTPAEIMAVAERVLAAIDPSLAPPASVRRTGVEPWARSVPAGEFPDALADAIAAERAAIGDGRLAVIVPKLRYAELAGSRPEVAHGPGSSVLDAPVALLDVLQSKGLEFDSVLIGDPAGIVAESARGLSDLYVAVSRATKRLGVLSPGELPDPLEGIPLGLGEPTVEST
jgi:DNA helicase IV